MLKILLVLNILLQVWVGLQWYPTDVYLLVSLFHQTVICLREVCLGLNPILSTLSSTRLLGKSMLVKCINDTLQLLVLCK